MHVEVVFTTGRYLVKKRGKNIIALGVEQHSLYSFEDVAMKNPQDVVDSHEMVESRDTYVGSLWQWLAFVFATFFSSK